MSWNSNPRWPGMNTLSHFYLFPFISFPVLFYDTPLRWFSIFQWRKPDVLRMSKPEFLTPMRTASKTISYVFFFCYNIKQRVMAWKIWLDKIIYIIISPVLWTLSLKQYPLWQNLAYFCSIVNCKNYILVFWVSLCSESLWANISTQKKTPNWED